MLLALPDATILVDMARRKKFQATKFSEKVIK